jgi:hypothetical protein
MADMDWHIFGDWRDLRGAIERGSPLWQDASEDERKRLWDFAQSVIAEYAPMKAKCLECSTIVPALAAYRCTECKCHLCEDCIHPHFGQNIWRHK